MKKGFTLMEILFVLLVIALVVSFAVPAIRTVRYDLYNARAKAALKKLAEARRSYYQYTKGADVSGSFDASSLQTFAEEACNDVAASGIPGSRSNSHVGQLFSCNFLDWKDFDLPYTFLICGTADAPVGAYPCFNYKSSNPDEIIYAAAMGNSSAAGSKYSRSYSMSIGQDLKVWDSED